MILEIANLRIVPGQEEKFESAFAQAREIVNEAPGFMGMELQRCVERPGEYALLARWRSVEDHTVHFRGSAAYERWRGLLHGFFDGRPEVSHYRLITDER